MQRNLGILKYGSDLHREFPAAGKAAIQAGTTFPALRDAPGALATRANGTARPQPPLDVSVGRFLVRELLE